MKIRYTKGPDEIELGSIIFKRGEAQDVGDELSAQALLPQRIAEYGFEIIGARPIAPTTLTTKE